MRNNMNSQVGKYLFLICSFIFWLFLALFSSKLIVDNLTSGHHYSNLVFNLHYLKNSGAAFSLLQNAREFLIILSVVVITLLFLYVIKNLKSIWFKEIFFISLLCAGISGNLHERIVLGYVRDFFQLKFVNFPVFNVSDIFINIAVIALVIIILLKKTK